jgi:agmatinase
MEFNPSSFAVRNGNFIGLPFTYDDSSIHLIGVPWDATVSSGAGTSGGPGNILEASLQLDLEDSDIQNAWKSGIYFLPIDEDILQLSTETRSYATKCIAHLEGGKPAHEVEWLISKVNHHCSDLMNRIELLAKQSLESGKLVGLIGGDHSVPLGYMRALQKYLKQPFGILQIDAHLDLRNAYEGFQFSHASIFHHVVEEELTTSLTQVGIRDFCQEELQFAYQSKIPIHIFKDSDLKMASYEGKPFKSIVDIILDTLPQNVYVSFDIDGLDPSNCPATGTPVPGGFSFQEAVYLLNAVEKSGRKIVGFDVCEVGGFPHQWDGNVGARIVYKLCTLMAKSYGKI